MPVVQVSLIAGRTKEQKRAMAEEITETVHKHSGAPREAVAAIFQDVEADDWAIAGTLFSERKKG